MSKQLFERLEEATARIEQIVLLAGAINDGDAISEGLEEFLGEDIDQFKLCFDVLSMDLVDALYGDDDEAVKDAFCEFVHSTGKYGFLVKFSTPLMKHMGEGRTSYSWGCWCTRWVYGETMDEAVESGLAWVASRRESELTAKEG